MGKCRYLIAVGAAGAPTAPVSGSGVATSRKSYCAVGRAVGGEVVEVPVLALREAHVAQVDHVHRHEHASGPRTGYTSNVIVSVATSATSWSRIHSIDCVDRPGDGIE